MKRILSLLGVALALVSCRHSVLEDRTACPSLLYFDIFNAGAFGTVDRVHVNACRYPDRLILGSDTTTIRALEGSARPMPSAAPACWDSAGATWRTVCGGRSRPGADSTRCSGFPS